VNPWGIAAAGDGPWWVANNATGTTTAYTANGQTRWATPSKSPAPMAVNGHGNPTGIVANSTNGFTVTKGAQTGPAEYVFVNEDGVISGWSQPSISTTRSRPCRRVGRRGLQKA